MTYVGAQTYDGSPEGGLMTSQSVFTKHPDLAGMFWGDGSGGAIAQPIHSRAPHVALLLTDTVDGIGGGRQGGLCARLQRPEPVRRGLLRPVDAVHVGPGLRVPDPCEIP